jgi:hypothetical protein
VGLMAEVHASFQQLAHAVIGQRHGLLRLFRRERVSPIGPPDGFGAHCGA